jgi:hypothetical protein
MGAMLLLMPTANRRDVNQLTASYVSELLFFIFGHVSSNRQLTFPLRRRVDSNQSAG